MSKRGRFIVFEGIDGCGKSTQLKKFVEYLFASDKYVHVVMTREPFKNVNIRSVLREDDDATSKAEKLAQLFIEDRFVHARELIEPLLSAGVDVVCDRYKLSTLAYQSAQGLDLKELIARHEGLPVPDLTFIVDVPASVAAQRMASDNRASLHKFEANIDFLEAVRTQFRRMPSALPQERIIIIDGAHNTEDVFAQVRRAFENPSKGPKMKYTSMEELPKELKDKLSAYVSSVGGDTFVIHGLPPELAGGVLARYSRAATGVQLTMVNEFFDENGNPSQEKGSELMDRVLNAYGDESVGELEGTHVGIENISQLATKTIEDRRIGGSPIEQSTRYVKYDQKDADGRWRYLRPKEIMQSPFADEYELVNDKAFETYQLLVGKLIDYFKRQFPEDKFTIEVERAGTKVKVHKHELSGEGEEKAFRVAYNFTVRCAALDVGRCLLPSSTLTHIGVFGNGRFFTHLISTLKSSELAEERERGFALENELKKVIPTFIKRNAARPENVARDARMRLQTNRIFDHAQPQPSYVTLVPRADPLDETVASSLFPYTNLSLATILNKVSAMSKDEKLAILREYMGKRTARRDRSGRALESGYPLTFDLVGGFAEYRDLERHRILTQQRQLLSVDLGFIMPPEVRELGMEKEVEDVVRMMESLNHKLRAHGLLVASQYATLFNHRIRFMMGMNLREFQHLAELRSQPAGHFSYRAMVQEMARAISKTYPWASMTHEFVDYSDPDNRITRAKEQGRIAGGNLKKGIENIDVDLT